MCWVINGARLDGKACIWGLLMVYTLQPRQVHSVEYFHRFLAIGLWLMR